MAVTRAEFIYPAVHNRIIEEFRQLYLNEPKKEFECMIPMHVLKRTIERFEKAVHARACALAVGPLDHATTFEYRQSKRELLALGKLLITGENPDNALELSSKKSSHVQPIPTGTALSAEPKEPSPR